MELMETRSRESAAMRVLLTLHCIDLMGLMSELEVS